MRGAIRLGVITAVVLASGAIGSGARADDPYSANQPAARDEATTTAEPARDAPGPGAASMEPAQGTDDAAGAEAQRAWVESIHDSL